VTSILSDLWIFLRLKRSDCHSRHAGHNVIRQEILIACLSSERHGLLNRTRYLLTDFFSTAQGMITLGALIGASSFALGAGARSIATGGNLLLTPARKQKHARSLAMQTVLALDDYVGSCYAAVLDKPEFNPADQIEFAFHVPEPVLKLPRDADWWLLGEELGEDIMWFSNRAANLENALNSLDLSKSGHDGFFERRIEGYARLAARAMDLIARVCGEFDLSMPEKPDYYRQADGLARILRSVESVAAQKAEALRTDVHEPTNITPLFPRST
jgi:hypothetical protein